MSLRLTFNPLAEQELNDAAAYYELSREGLGRGFIDEVERAVAHIAEFPEAAPLVNRVVRTYVLHRFPYSILYSIIPDGIRILAIANQRRRPFYWRGRR
jgi:plasmid stabilization system protein ParE